MQRTIKTHVKHTDGTEQDLQQVSEDPFHLTQFICGIADERPGEEITFTLVSTGNRFPTQ